MLQGLTSITFSQRLRLKLAQISPILNISIKKNLSPPPPPIKWEISHRILNTKAIWAVRIARKFKVQRLNPLISD
jgi:hypothetical protein